MRSGAGYGHSLNPRSFFAFLEKSVQFVRFWGVHSLNPSSFFAFLPGARTLVDSR